MHNSFGNHYRITTFGESHGPAIGVIIDGCPSGHTIDLQRVGAELKRRRPGQSKITSPRDEADLPEVLSGIENGISLGTPIAIIVRNTNVKPQDYGDMATVFRPSHADYTSFVKYGIRPSSGGGRASARETIGRVAGAAIAEQILENIFVDYRCVAWVDSVGDIVSQHADPTTLTRAQVDENIVRCPNAADANAMIKKIEAVGKSGDTVGGTISLCISNVAPGIGEPIFDKLESVLAGAMMSLPATKGFEIGSGFAATAMRGSEHNDEFVSKKGKISTSTNNSGGIQGGISNGQPILCRIAFKPVSTIFKEQQTIDDQGNETTLKPKAGRHDPCVVPRAVPMVEAMANLVLLDLTLAQLARQSAKGDQCRKI